MASEITFEPPTISPDEAPGFFLDHGIFYEEDRDIGKLVEESKCNGTSKMTLSVKQLLAEDSCLAKILEPFDELRFSFTIGPDKGKFYACTIQQNQDHRAIVCLWSPGTELEFSYGAHKVDLIGVPASNGFVHIPYSFLTDIKRLKERTIILKEGGIMIAHVRAAINVKAGFAFGDGWQKSTAVRAKPSPVANTGPAVS